MHDHPERSGAPVRAVSGVVVFRTLSEAFGAGFQVYDRQPDGELLLRRFREGRFELALCLADREAAA